MAIILIRANKKEKILNTLADLERHAKLKIIGKPKKLPSKLADETFSNIINQKLKTRSKWAVMVKVKEDTTKSIMQVQKIHPPAHIIVLSKEYNNYNKLKRLFDNLSHFPGYYSLKNRFN